MADLLRSSVLALTVLTGALVCCSSTAAPPGTASNDAGAGGGAGATTAPPPGDHFFDSAATPTGPAASPTSRARIAVLLFDPTHAANHPAGQRGSDPAKRAAAARIVVDGAPPVDVDGTWDADGSVTVQGGGWELHGKVADAIVTGTYQGPAGPGVFAGADVARGRVAVSTGQLQGNAFAIVVSRTGIVTGVVGGPKGGFVTGKASGDSLTYSWDANDTKGSGTATVAPGGQVTGHDSGASPVNPLTRCDGTYETRGPATDTPGCRAGCHAVGSSDALTFIVRDGRLEDAEALEMTLDAAGCIVSTLDKHFRADLIAVTCTSTGDCQCDSTSAAAYGCTVGTSCSFSLTCKLTKIGGGGASTSDWQTTPTPCTERFYLTPEKLAQGAVECPIELAGLDPSTCAGGNADACRGPCNCPPIGGCAKCGGVTACCVE